MQRQETRHVPQTIGANLRAARIRKGLTQHQLSIAAGTQAFQVSRWEKGRHRPKDEMLVSLGDVLGMSLADFYAEPEGVAA